MSSALLLLLVFPIVRSHRPYLSEDYFYNSSMWSDALPAQAANDHFTESKEIIGPTKTFAVSVLLVALSGRALSQNARSSVAKSLGSDRIRSCRKCHLVASLADASLKDTLSAEATSAMENCMDLLASFRLPGEIATRVESFIWQMLLYNDHTNIYSKSAYGKLPFHMVDSLTLALHIRDHLDAKHGVLDIGSGSGLPSLIIACVNPELPVYAIESRSRKTRFLASAAKKLSLANYMPLTQNVKELSQSWYFEVDVITAKAFKPLPEVGPIGRRCIREQALLLIPISESQVSEFSIPAEQLVRYGELIYFRDALVSSHNTYARKLVTAESVRTSRL